MNFVSVLGTMGDLYFRGQSDPKSALTVREISKVAEQLGKIPADNMGRIEFAGQSIDSIQMIREAYKPLGANQYGPLASFSSLLVNAAVSYTGSVEKAASLISDFKLNKAKDADVMGVVFSVDPGIQHVSHDSVVTVIDQVVDGLPWLARKGIGLVDQFLEGVLGEQDPRNADPQEDVSTKSQLLEPTEGGVALTKTRLDKFC